MGKQPYRLENRSALEHRTLTRRVSAGASHRAHVPFQSPPQSFTHTYPLKRTSGAGPRALAGEEGYRDGSPLPQRGETVREQLGVAGLLDSLLLTRAFEMCEIGQELLALALLGGLGTLVVSWKLRRWQPRFMPETCRSALKQELIMICRAFCREVGEADE